MRDIYACLLKKVHLLCFGLFFFAQNANAFNEAINLYETPIENEFNCTTLPIITCPPDFIGCPGDDISSASLGVATALPGGSNCSQPIIGSYDLPISTGPCTGQLFIKRIWYAYDPSDASLYVDCAQEITLIDETDPITDFCPANISVVPNQNNCTATVTWINPQFSDNCTALVVSSNYNSGDAFANGTTTTVIYTATDLCGNTTSCSFDVTVDGSCCFDPPIISCPPTYVGCPTDSIDPSNTGTGTVAPGSTNCLNPNLSYVDAETNPFNCAISREITRTWIATDPEDPSNTSTCTQLIQLRDTEEPTLTNCPTDLSVDSNDGLCVSVNWTAPTAMDNCQISSLTADYTIGECFPVGSTTVTYLALDGCGNNTSCSFIVTVNDVSCMNGPNLICPDDYTSCPGTNDSNPKETGLPQVTPGGPNCGAPVVAFTDNVISTSTCGEQIIERTWTAYDADNPSFISSCIQTISFIDNLNPVITNCPQNQTLSSIDGNCVEANWNLPQASDNCDLASFTATHNAGECLPLGITEVSYLATDGCGNTSSCSFTIEVVDNSCTALPLISCPNVDNSCPQISTDPTISGYATATAGSTFCDPPLVTFEDIVTNPFPCNNTYQIERIWTATDPNNPNLTASCTQIITRNDINVPLISCPNDISLVSLDGLPVSVSWNAPSATDNCGSVSVTSNYSSGDDFPVGTTVVSYTATDLCGNTSRCEFLIEIIDNSCNTAPIITCPDEDNSCPHISTDPSISGYAIAIAGSSLCSTPIVEFSDIISYPYPCTGSFKIERTWTSYDPDKPSLSSSCVQIITRNDIYAPVITCVDDIIETSIDGLPVEVTWTAPTASDNCGATTLSSNFTSGDTFPIGTSTVTYTATDVCGNTSSCEFTIEIIDNSCNTAPIISCPDVDNSCPHISTDPSISGFATAIAGSSLCADPIVEYSDEVSYPFPCTGSYKIERTWKAYDPLKPSLVSTCVQTITRNDIYAPVITCIDDITQTSPDGLSMEIHWTAPVASDNCGSTNITSNYNSGDIFPIGTTTVTYTATNNCGNTSTCSFDITIESNFQITCPSDTIVQCNGPNGTAVHWELPAVQSGCGVDCLGGGAIAGFVYMGTFNGHHYYCSEQPDTWANAQAFCDSAGGHLAIVNSAAENAFIANFLTTQSAYIGCSDHTNEGQWTWVDGSPVTYSNWYTDQPNNFNGAQHFCEMLNNGQWNDQYGKVALEFVMEIPCDNIVQTSGPANGSVIPTGTHEVCYELTDNCGSKANCCFNVTVESSISINCYNDAHFTVPNGKSGLIVNWNTPEVNSCCSANSCQDGGHIDGFVYMGNYGGSHYYCSTSPDTWVNAQANCASLGGHLAIINDANENAFVASLLTTQTAYIGCSDFNNEGNWTWNDGSTVTYSNWYPGQPNNQNGSQHYCEMLSNGQWNDQYAKTTLEYVMEIPACINVSQIAGPPSGSYFAPNTTTTITYQAQDACGNSTTCSFDIVISANYCLSGGQNSNYVYIEQCGFGPINHQSGNNGGYADFSSTCHDVSPGDNIPINLTPGFGSSGKLVCYWKIYCDWNQDYDFFDSGELCAYGAGTGTLTGFYNVPGNVSGQCRVRVVMKYGSYPTGPCEIFPHGETEDYCLNVLPPEANVASTDIAYREELDPINLGEFIPPYQPSIDDTRIAVQVYPNPVSSILNININSDQADWLDAQLLNIEGKVVRTIKNVEANKVLQIDVADLQNGIYMLQVNNGSDLISKRIIVSK